MKSFERRFRIGQQTFTPDDVKATIGQSPGCTDLVHNNGTIERSQSALSTNDGSGSFELDFDDSGCTALLGEWSETGVSFRFA